MSYNEKNLIDARRIYFSSLLFDSEYQDLYNEGNVNGYDDYLDNILKKSLQDRMQVAFMESKENTILNNRKKLNKDALKIAEENSKLSEIQKKEFQHFKKYFKEKEAWDKKKTDYIAHYEKVKSDRLEESEDTLERISKVKLEKSIVKKKKLAEMLEELCKSLLLSTSGIDFLEDTKPNEILFD